MKHANEKKYEIINPHDKCFVFSNNKKVAMIVAYVLGNGAYGLKDADTGKILLHPFDDLTKRVGFKDEKQINDFFDSKTKELAHCFESFRYDGERTSLTDIGNLAAAYADSFRAKAEGRA